MKLVFENNHKIVGITNWEITKCGDSLYYFLIQNHEKKNLQNDIEKNRANFYQNSFYLINCISLNSKFKWHLFAPSREKEEKFESVLIA